MTLGTGHAALIMLLVVPAFTFAQSPRVHRDLARMLEEVVAKTGLSINVSRSELKSVEINRVDGVSVCDPAASEKVVRLQRAFADHPLIKTNVGPALMTITNVDRSVTMIDRKELAAHGAIPAEGCIPVSVSVH